MIIPLDSPYDIISKQTITSFTYRVTDIILFESATVLILFLDENENCIRTVQYVVEGEEYAEWSDDDQYIVDLIVEKIPDLLK
jgi:hypothetical protein